MKRIDNSTAVDDLFTDGNPATGTPATVLPAQWLNVVQEEIAYVIEQASITLDQTGADTTQLHDAILALTESGDGGSVPSGAIMDYAGATAPAGWLWCAGQAVSRDTYADLFSALGTVWGAGDGSTTFNLPDLRGRVAAGKDDMNGTAAERLVDEIDGDALGAYGGAEQHTLVAGELPSVRPTFKRNNQQNVADGSDGSHSVYDYTNGITPAISGAALGSDDPHNNLQPTAIVNKIIKT